MKNKYKIILIICVIIGICSILVGSIAYYRIVVEGNIKGSTGNAVFVLKDENSNVWNNKEINLGKVNPGDSGEFTVTMDASGSTVDMYATLEIERTNLPTNLKFYTTSDHKSELHKYYSFLETTKQTETLTIYWYWNPYIDDIEDSKFINIDNIEAKIRVSAVQISEYTMMKNGNGVTSSDRMYFWKDNYRPYIRTITFGNDLSNLPSSCTEENLCFDITETGSKRKVYGYLVDSGLKFSEDETKSLYNLYIVSEAPIFAPTDCSLFFAGFNSLVNINYNNNFNTSLVTNISYMYVPFTPGDWSSVVTLASMNNNIKPSLLSNNDDCKTELLSSGGGDIGYYSPLEEVNLSSFNTSNVTNMNSMFYHCSSLTSLDMSSFNTSNVTNMAYMFSGCSSLINLELNNFNTSNVTNMNSMFYHCSSLTSLDMSSFNTSKVTNMSSMFDSCYSLINIDLNSFNTSNVTNMSSMFNCCFPLISLDLNSFNTVNVTDMSCMFVYCSSLISLNLCNFNTSNVTNMDSMFSNCSSLTSLDLSSFNTSKVTNMSYMFSGCKNLTTTINIMNANVTNYGYMFLNAATDPNAKITVNYIADASTLVDRMIATKSSNSNVVKGKQI